MKRLYIERETTETVRVAIVCPLCNGTPHRMLLPTPAFRSWCSGTMVQDAFPQLDADDRERLISGICPPCFNGMFGE